MLGQRPGPGPRVRPALGLLVLRQQRRLACVVAEVHNTYGERHAYLLQPDEAGTAVTGKDFYVSPFFDVTGTYGLRFTLSAGPCVHDRDAAPRGRRRVLGGLPGPARTRHPPDPGPAGSSASP